MTYGHPSQIECPHCDYPNDISSHLIHHLVVPYGRSVWCELPCSECKETIRYECCWAVVVQGWRPGER